MPTGAVWRLVLIEAGYQGEQHRRIWDELLDAIGEWSKEGAECERLIAERCPELPESSDDLDQEKVLNEIIAHLSGGRQLDFLSQLFHPKWRYLKDHSNAMGNAPSTAADFRALRAVVRLRRLRREPRERWDRRMSRIGGPVLGEPPEQSAARLKETMLDALDWRETHWAPFEAELISSGFDWPTLLRQTPPDLGTYGELKRLYRCLAKDLVRRSRRGAELGSSARST